jgi:competence protein ComEC
VQLNHFFRFAPWAPLNNLILLPLGGLVISALFAAACLGLAAPPLFAVLAWPIDALLQALAAAAQGLSGLPMSLVVTGQPSHWAILVALAAVVHIGLARRPEGRARWRVAATSVVLALLCLQAAWVHRPGPGLTVSFFAVGQGDAALVRCGRQAVLVDFGPPGPPGSAGSSRFSRCVLPYLHATRAFPSLGVLSHPHADHIGGMADAMRQFPAMLVLTRECLEEASAAWVDAEELGLSARLAGMDREGTVVMPAGKVGGRGPQLVLELFWAPGLGRGAHVNELSCALRVYRRDGGPREGPDRRPAAVLFTGDLGHEAEAALVAGRAELLPGAVLKVGHHGSGGSTGERFLQAVSPALAVISVGQNGYGHPAPECLERLARAGVAVLRTDTAGWIRVRVDGEGIRVETFIAGGLQRAPAR